MSQQVSNPFPIKAVTEMIHKAVLDERARCIRIANHDAHLAAIGAMKFSFAGKEGTGHELAPLEIARRMAEVIAMQIEVGDDPGICNCENERLS